MEGQEVPVETPYTDMLTNLKNMESPITARAESMELLSFEHEKTSHSSELKKVTPSKVAILHDRTCNCASNHLNCLTAKEWLKSQLGVWEFYYNGRDVRDKNIHPAVFPLSLAKRVIEVFSHKGELVIDPFTGISTTLLAARDWKETR